MNKILEQLHNTKHAAAALALLDDATRNAVLTTLSKLLRDSIPAIIAANAKDLANIDKQHPMFDRLLLNEARLLAIATDIDNVVNLDSPLGKVLLQREMPNKLQIKKVSTPLGVVAVIYESRPNVTIDVFTLCFKSGNACVLKGGKEAFNSNEAFIKLIHKSLLQHNLNPDCVYFFPPDRTATNILLNAVGLIDVCIPRGSQALIDYVREHAKIPVIETGAGIVHLYFDVAGDLEIGTQVINNSKTRRVSVCNALDCLLVHQQRLKDLPQLLAPLQQHQVEIFADAATYAALQKFYPTQLLQHATDQDYGKEFLSYKLALKTVANVEQAIEHIMSHTSGHSEAIITEDNDTADYFVQRIDAAAVYVNASTAFTDGAQFGMGAEIGISTQKLHARGPMGLENLTSYKWIIHGTGQIRA